MAIIDADVIVVGAGTGGLTAAAYLAVAGRGVIVVDRGPAPGGHATVFNANGFQFDVGLHTLGSGSDGNPATQPMLDPLGITLEYNRIDPVDTIVLPDARVEIPTGLDGFRSTLHEALPDEREPVDRYLELVETVDSEAAALVRVRGLSDVPKALWHSRGLVRNRRTTLSDAFEHCGLSTRARAILGWISPLYGLPPAEVSLIMHAMMTMHYVHGAWYPRGGGAVISQRLAEVIRAHGGWVLLEHEVTRIDVEGGRVAGVTATGPDGAQTRLRAPVVASNADIKRTFSHLVDPSVVPRDFRRRIRGYEMSLPLAVVHAILDRDLVAEGLPPTNYLVPGDGPDAAYRSIVGGAFPTDPPVWITSASLKDPDNPDLCQPGQTNVQLMTVVPSRLDAWGLEVGVRRGRDYSTAKEALREQVLASADRAIPGFSDAVVFDMVATPYTFQRYTGVTDGAAYGIAATPDQMVMGRPGPRTPVPGLFLVGASTRSGHGITGVMAGGIATASAILGSSAVSAAWKTAR